ncbi:Glucosylglycerol-phosphate phosphatase [Frankliniella fusca]|uniref:Glucosylglycerol-phosphate phosphatase n=1 Tax=Frankliniella fusca TaxID=407009 RepID=A0AAE1LHD3_9NEOP|nr:Glucosylglycerol-phosphate phosphatase [Frankliniella fusca]
MAAPQPHSTETVATQIPFATSPERRSPTAGGQTPLITQDPELYVLQDDNPVPMFVGMNSREWLFSFYYYGYAANPEYMRSRIANLITVFPKTVVPHSETASYLQLTNTLTIQQAVAKAHAEFFEHYAPNCDDTCVFKKVSKWET